MQMEKIVWFRQGMKKHFGITNDVHSYLVKELLPFGEVTLDIIKFDDDYLIPKVGDYIEEGKSMKDILEEKFGEEASKFIEQAIG